MNFFDLLKSVYEKKKMDWEINTQLNLTLLKWLSYDKNNLQYLKGIIKYQFINPKNFFYLIFLTIPRGRAPFIKKPQTKEIKKDEFIEKIANIFSWSKRESRLSQDIVKKVCDKQYWEKELGLK